MTIYRFSFPTRIHFGPGVRADAATHLEDAGLKRPLIVTDRARALPLSQELERRCSAAARVGGLLRHLGQPGRSRR